MLHNDIEALVFCKHVTILNTNLPCQYAIITHYMLWQQNYVQYIWITSRIYGGTANETAYSGEVLITKTATDLI